MQSLFRSQSIFDVQEGAKRQLKLAVQNLTEDQVRNPETLEQLIRDHSFEIPVLDDSRIEVVSQKNVPVDARNYPNRIVFDRSRPVWIDGTEITIGIPFIGDGDWFHVQPTSFNLNPPWGEVVGSEIHLVYRRPDYNTEALKADYTRNISEIKKHLDWLKSSADSFNHEVRSLANQLVQQRLKHFEQSTGMVQGLGLPVRPQLTEPPAQPLSSASPDNASKVLRKPVAKKWDVFVSHATEDKDEIARPLAKALCESGLKIWFDEATLRLGDSLRAKIDEGLAHSRYGLVILSEHFFAKHWTQQELNGLATREIGGQKVILPIWHKIDQKGVAAHSPMLADKLAARSDQGLESIVKQILDVVRSGQHF